MIDLLMLIVKFHIEFHSNSEAPIDYMMVLH